MPNFRSITVTNTSTNISAIGADVIGANIVNRHSAIVYVKFYNSTVATFQDTPVFVIPVAASGGQFFTKRNAASEYLFSTTLGMCVRVVTGSADNDNTAAATLPIINIEYK